MTNCPSTYGRPLSFSLAISYSSLGSTKDNTGKGSGRTLTLASFLCKSNPVLTLALKLTYRLQIMGVCHPTIDTRDVCLFLPFHRTMRRYGIKGPAPLDQMVLVLMRRQIGYSYQHPVRDKWHEVWSKVTGHDLPRMWSLGQRSCPVTLL